MPIDKVLLAVGKSDEDRIETLAAAVANVANPTGAEVSVLHVFSEDGFRSAVSKLDFDSPAEADPDEVAGRRAFVRDLVDRLDGEGLDVALTGVVGDAADSILEQANENGVDMVFMGGRKRRPTGKAVFGSSVQTVMLNADCPVTYVREGMHVD